MTIIIEPVNGIEVCSSSDLLPGPHPLGPKEIDGLLVPPDKPYTLLTGHLITG